MYKTCVIGAGAAGLIAGIEASSHRSDVIMIDKNKKAGMKLYTFDGGAKAAVTAFAEGKLREL